MTCESRKDAFPSKRKAAEVAARTQHRAYHTGKSVHRIETYHCTQCNGWHVTGHNGNNLNRRNN